MTKTLIPIHLPLAEIKKFCQGYFIRKLSLFVQISSGCSVFIDIIPVF